MTAISKSLYTLAIEQLVKSGVGTTVTLAGTALILTGTAFAAQYSLPSLSAKNLSDSADRYADAFGRIWGKINVEFRKPILKSIAIFGALGTAITAFQIAVQIIGTYGQAYLSHYVGRPKLAMEYEFDSWGSRFSHMLCLPYTCVMDLFQHTEKKEPLKRPIFNPEVQEQIDLIESMTKNMHKNEGYFSNLLLYGPPGTGKTMISRVLAKSAGTNYFMMSGADLTQYIKRGEHVSELNNLFERAKNASKPTIIFIDEVESLAKNREDLNMERVELLNAFLNHTGEPSKKFMLILATNRPKDLDPAVLSRMDNQIYIGPPEENERLKIFNMYLDQFFNEDPLFTSEYVLELNQKMTNFTGRDIFKFCNMLAVAKSAQSNNKLTHKLAQDTLDKFLKNRALIQSQIEQLKL